MRFAPPPLNQFTEFIDSYYDRCRSRCPNLVAIGGKWDFEDLIPGLSDFDSRLVFADGMSASDWTAASLAVGEIHTEFARTRREWARILEHLPGVNVTPSELLHPSSYTAEVHLWTMYHGNIRLPDPSAWNSADEYFHLKKFATYYGPYERGIDPPVNLGPFENKYALHSRYMHYFTPAVQAAVAIMKRAPVRGKLKSLEHARELFPNPRTIDRIFDIIAVHYQVPDDYEDPRLALIESELYNYLRSVAAILSEHLTLTNIGTNPTPEYVRNAVESIRIAPDMKFFGLTRFSRLMQGRLLFFSENIPWFETDWLIRNELSRLEPWFYSKALRAYSQAVFNENLEADQAIERLRGSVLPASIADGYRKFSRIASESVPVGYEKEQARRIAGTFEPALYALELLGSELKAHSKISPIAFLK